MSLYRKNPRRDANEAEIVEALRAIGVDVRRLSGKDVPDLLCGHGNRTWLIGVKAPDGPRGGMSHGRGRKSGDHKPPSWPGGPWVIVTTVDEALSLFRAIAPSRIKPAKHDYREVTTEADLECGST